MPLLRIDDRRVREAEIKAKIQFKLDKIGSREFVVKGLSLERVLVM